MTAAKIVDVTGKHPIRCVATVKMNGQQCRRNAIQGATVCNLHGAKAPHVKAAAARRVQEAQLLAAVATYGLPRDITPEQALIDELHRTAGHVDWLAAKIRSMEPDELVWGTIKIEDREATEFKGLDTTEGATLSQWLEAYRWERAHLIKVAKTMADLGLQERSLELEESQAFTVMAAVTLAYREYAAFVGVILDEVVLRAMLRRHLLAEDVKALPPAPADPTPADDDDDDDEGPAPA